MAKGQLVHYGKLLSATMVEQKKSKAFVMEKLGITDVRTFDLRVEDAKFSYDQLKALKLFNLI